MYGGKGRGEAVSPYSGGSRFLTMYGGKGGSGAVSPCSGVPAAAVYAQTVGSGAAVPTGSGSEACAGPVAPGTLPGSRTSGACQLGRGQGHALEGGGEERKAESARCMGAAAARFLGVCTPTLRMKFTLEADHISTTQETETQTCEGALSSAAVSTAFSKSSLSSTNTAT